MSFTIKQDDLTSPAVVDLLRQHLALMISVTPPGSVHALDLEGLKRTDITAWTLWQKERLLGCGALRELDQYHGEIKSMHIVHTARGQGVGQAMLDHVLDEARRRGYRRISLETGVMEAFAPARTLYAKNGFSICPPFGDYTPDPNSVCMTRTL